MLTMHELSLSMSELLLSLILATCPETFRTLFGLLDMLGTSNTFDTFPDPWEHASQRKQVLSSPSAYSATP